MIVIHKDEFANFGYNIDGDGNLCPVGIPSRQKTVEPDTAEEMVALRYGHCPQCGSKLAGDNGKFCVKDQLWWVFDLDNPVA